MWLMSEPVYTIEPARSWDLLTLTRMTYANMTGVDRQFTRFIRNPLIRPLGYFFVPLYLLTAGRGFKAVSNGRILGCAFLHLAQRSGMAFNVHVNRPHRRQGIGRALMEHLEIRARWAEREWLGLLVGQDNDAAQNLYRSLDYRPYNSHFLRSNNRSVMQGAPLPGVHVQRLPRREGRRLWSQYADLERREGDSWAAPVVTADFDEGPPPGGSFWRCYAASEEMGVAWMGGEATWPLIALLLRPAYWERRMPTVSLLHALLARQDVQPQTIDVYFGSSAHYEAALPFLRQYGFAPRRQANMVMLKRL